MCSCELRGLSGLCVECGVVDRELLLLVQPIIIDFQHLNALVAREAGDREKIESRIDQLGCKDFSPRVPAVGDATSFVYGSNDASELNAAHVS